MAKKDSVEEKPINAKKINESNRTISGNINSVMDNLFSTIFGTTRSRDVDELNTKFDSILKADLTSLTDKSGGDLTDFVSKLWSASEKRNAAYARNMEDMFHMDNNQLETFLNDAYRSRMLKQSDIHEVTAQLNELKEAILITRDAIVSSDIVDGHMSRTISFRDASSIEGADEFNQLIEKIEETFKLQEKIKNFIVPKTLEFGEYYAYVIPYSKIFEDFSRMKEKDYTMHKSIFESCSDKELKSLAKGLSEKITADTPEDITTHSLKVKAEVQRIFENVLVSNDSVPLCVLENGVDSIGELMDQYITEAGENEPDDKKKSSGSKSKDTKKKSKFHDVIDGPGVQSDKGEKKNISEYSEIKDCYVKLIDPMHMIPIKIMNKVIGYYYVHETSIILNASATTDSVYYYSKYDDRKREKTLIDAISTKIVQSFDKKFLNDNMAFKSIIVEAINYYNLHEKQIKFQYIPVEYVVPFKINEDEDGNGTSIIEPALFYAKLFLVLLLFKMMSIVMYSNDTKMHYLRQSGIDKNIINKTQELARKMQNRNINLLDMFSYTTLVQKVGKGNEIFIPIGQSGERGLETEILQGQEVPINNELMELLRSGYISATGVPAVIMNYINEADFAKTLELGNTRFQGRVVSNQLDFNPSITDLYRKILKYSTNMPPQIIEAVRFSFTPPKYSNVAITNELISGFQSLMEMALPIVFGQNAMDNPAEYYDQIDEWKILLAKEKLPHLNIDRLLELKEEAIINSNKKKLLPKGTTEEEEPQ